MNKPAAKEPSMDEILSSIRQIIADDDAAAPPRRPAAAPVPSFQDPIASPFAAFAEPEPEPAPVAAAPAAEEPLPLSAEQIVSDPAEAEPEDTDFSALLAKAPVVEDAEESAAGDFMDPEDIAFEADAEEDAAPVPAPVAVERPLPPSIEARPRPTAAQAAPMPDPKLSSDIAEELLEPTTNAAVRANFAKLNNLGLGNPGLTLEAMMREMLRPMLKDWLDEHLPAVVERMVEKEISRVARGD